MMPGSMADLLCAAYLAAPALPQLLAALHVERIALRAPAAGFRTDAALDRPDRRPGASGAALTGGAG
ncbi:hypothetical protein [Streptomyces sp. NPDC050485]|uniref:hypothetical protein n=1 Tax=Streptomyces sp. NPDC050485 TaxID=3365617 RepID=UPI00379AE700